jgi:signal transduction histidine kinase
MYENLLQKEQIVLDYDENPEENYFISGDRHRMKQVFLNVIDNAAKYGADGGKIKVSIARRHNTIRVKVRDYGPGIPEPELPFVKEKFYKGSSKQRGSGIGLSVTDEIVKLHGGTLEIKSRVGEGTIVVITVPAVQPGNPETPQEDKHD